MGMFIYALYFLKDKRLWLNLKVKIGCCKQKAKQMFPNIQMLGVIKMKHLDY